MYASMLNLGKSLAGNGRYILTAFSLLFAAVLLTAAVLYTAVSQPPAAAAAETGEVQVRPVNAFPNLQFVLPVVIANAGDERLFIVEQTGLIWSISGRGELATRTLFLNINGRVQDGGERGLLGLAFHPRYEQNGYFYVNYTHLRDGASFSRVSRFQDTAVANSVDPASEVILLEVRQPYSNHNGGDLHFDPQGMLVIALGDGGSGGDPQNRAQDPQTLLGKLLRIDVDRAEGGKNYAIPADNPFIGQAPLDEIWMLGLRNPWRFSFDRQTGDLYIGDVGQNKWEEINFLEAAESGGQNFEWRRKEGFDDFNLEEPAGPGELTEPVYVYKHKDDAQCYSVVGGYVYRGPQSPLYNGMYIFADYCSGKISGLFRDRRGKWQHRSLARGEVTMTTFGEDSPGELYFSVHGSGKIFRLVLNEAQSQSLLPVIFR